MCLLDRRTSIIKSGLTIPILAAVALLLAAQAAVASSPGDPLQTYLSEALDSNSALHAQDYATEAAAHGLAAARARSAPTIALSARYTVSEGGRTIEIPTGDLVNPIYQTLNQLTAGTTNPTQFQNIDNTDIRFLRAHEQDTRLTFSAPLYAPQISAEIRVRAAQLDGNQATREAYARTLVRDVKTAYYQLARAQAGVMILEASRLSLAENLRVATALVDSGKATRDRRLRAEAELLAIEQRLRAAGNEQRGARRYLNLLRNRDESEPVLVQDDVATEHAPKQEADLTTRPELRGLDAQIASAEGLRTLAGAAYKPTLAFVANSGIQGSSYRVNKDSDVSSASLVLSWTLFDFGARRAEVSQARAQSEQLRATREELTRRLALAQLGAADDLDTAQDGLVTADARRAAAEESFRIAERKLDAGQLSQIEFLDAERAATDARLGLAIARADLRIARAALEYAHASFDLPIRYVAGSTP